MMTLDEIKLGLVKAAIEGKINGYKKGIEHLGEGIYPELKLKYEGIIEELEDILKLFN